MTTIQENYHLHPSQPVENPFLSGSPRLIGFLNSALKELEKMIQESTQATEIKITCEEPLQENLWGFGFIWHDLLRTISTVERLYEEITNIHQKIAATKDQYRSVAIPLSDFKVIPNVERGVSGSYFLVDDHGQRHYIIKPFDEDAGCLNNPEGYLSLSGENFLRNNMPAYRSAMREVLAYRVAQEIGLGEIVPKTALGILHSDQFHDFFHQVAPKERSRYLEKCGSPDYEKLCSIQEFVPHAKSLFEARHDLQRMGLTDEEIGNRFDQTDFENANILLWTTYDTDGHTGNFLVVPKGVDAIGNELFGLKKIDNGLAFPDKNRQLRNQLVHLPNGKKELSEEAKAKIAAIDIEKLSLQFKNLGMESACTALKERITYLQDLVQKPGITIKEINKEMSKIGNKI